MVRVRVDATDPDPASIETAAAAIRAGGLVILPTDTLYGLAADPSNEDAVRRVFAVKGRGAGQALPLIAADTAQVVKEIGALSPVIQQLAECFWPGPLTILLPAPASMAAEASGGTWRVGVRVPDHHVARALCRACGFLLTATSANASGAPASHDPDIVAATIGAQVDVLLDAGRTAGGRPSTIMEVAADGLRLVRAGAIPLEQIEACLHL